MNESSHYYHRFGQIRIALRNDSKLWWTLVRSLDILFSELEIDRPSPIGCHHWLIGQSAGCKHH
eukprot:scaffold8320_cov27-Prasinocladus_malaysianus.AAC.1